MYWTNILRAPLGTHIHFAQDGQIDGSHFGASTEPGICLSVEITDDPSNHDGEWPVRVFDSIRHCHRPMCEHAERLEDDQVELLVMPIGAHVHLGPGIVEVRSGGSKVSHPEGVCARSIVQNMNEGRKQERAFRPLVDCPVLPD